MTYRYVASHIRHLPDDSRYVRHLRTEAGIPWDQDDHHRQDMVDLLQLAVYFLQTGPLSSFSKKEQTRVIRDAPKRPKRPGEAEQEKPPMSTKQEIFDFFNRG